MLQPGMVMAAVWNGVVAVEIVPAQRECCIAAGSRGEHRPPLLHQPPMRHQHLGIAHVSACARLEVVKAMAACQAIHGEQA